jgi:hypothetical protein
MKRISYKIARYFDGPSPVVGFEIPKCGGFLGVDKRNGEWKVTHIPTGYLIGPACHRVRKEAIRLAQIMYRLGERHGSKWRSKVPKLAVPKAVVAATKRHRELKFRCEKRVG